MEDSPSKKEKEEEEEKKKKKSLHDKLPPLGICF